MGLSEHKQTQDGQLLRENILFLVLVLWYADSKSQGNCFPVK